MNHRITEEEFEQLYRRTAPELFGYLRRRTTIEVEDLVAEVFAIAWRRRGALPAPELRRAWLFGTARRLVLFESRQHRRDHEVMESVAVFSAAPDDNADPQHQQMVADALARLEPRDREIIELVEWERLSPGEAAVALGIRPGTARVRLHRARQALAADPAFSALVGHQRPADTRVNLAGAGHSGDGAPRLAFPIEGRTDRICAVDG